MSTGGVAATDQAVAALLKQAANRGEAIVDAIRLVFSELMLARVFYYWGPNHGASIGHGRGLDAAGMVGAIVLFVAGLVWALRGRFTPTLLVVSTLADAVICGLSLSTNVFWPSTRCPGLLRMPDVGALLM